MTRRVGDIVVIGASAGGIVALKRLLQMLPSDLNASILSSCTALICWHKRKETVGILWPKYFPSVFRYPLLRRMMGSVSREVMSSCAFGLRSSHRKRARASGASPTESSFRPSADALFRSAALEYGRRVIGVMLSGLLTDGTAGLWQIRKRGASR